MKSIRLIQNESTLSYTVKNVVYILDTHKRVVYKLNDVASSIWIFIKKPRTLSDIVSHILSVYTVNDQIARKDIHEFLQAYKRRGLIRIVPSGK